MPWPNLRFDQTDLARLCVEWDVQAAEYHVHNQLYGFDQLLREYAGLPHEPLPWAMEHFISFGDPQPYPIDAASRLPFVLAVSELQADVLRQQVRVPVHAIGSAFFYMRQLWQQRFPLLSEETERRGTLVFPDKSTMNKDTDFDRDRFARALAALPEEFQPVCVSVFWKDFVRGTHRPFEQAGLTLVTSGHPHDPLFLFRQYDLCRQFRYACANDLSTSFCLSVLAGCRFFHQPSGPLRITINGVSKVHAAEPTLSLPGKQECLNASRFPPSDDRRQQVEIAERFAGKANVRPPEFFRELFTEGQRRLAANKHTFADVDFNRQHALDVLASWSPRGIDPDGWAIAESRFEVASRLGFAGVSLRLSIPPRPAKSWQGQWTLLIDDEPQSLSVTPGRWLLSIPSRSDGLPRRVVLRADGVVPLGSDPRHRAFRIKDITWQRRLSNQQLTRLRRWHPAYSASGERFLHRLWTAAARCRFPQAACCER